METVVLWFGFVGSWLLFAGPIYQAALELMDQDIEFERLRMTRSKITPPPNVSFLWWFLPPVKVYLEHNRSNLYRRRYIEALSSEDVEALVGFVSKATGWFMVALGGLCIAIKETFELCHAYEVNEWIFVIIVVVMGFISILYTAFQTKRNQKIVSSTKG